MRFVRFAVIASSLPVFLQAGCMTLGENGAGTVAGGNHSGCSLTMQDNSLAQTCGELVLRNSGTATMHGWQIQFTLANGGQLVNTWNGTFAVDGNVVTVRPAADNLELAPAATTTLGYCASGPTSNMVLVAGVCNVEGSNTTVPAVTSQLVNQNAGETAFADDFASLDNSRWSVEDGNNIPGNCVNDANAVAISGGALHESLASTAGSATTCGGLSSTDTYLYGQFGVVLQATSATGAVTRFATRASTRDGAQAITMDWQGGQSHDVTVTVWSNNTSQSFTIPLDFDASAAAHRYGYNWQASSIVFYVDGVGVRTITQGLPAPVPAHIAVETQLVAGATVSDPATVIVSHVSYVP